MELLYWVSGGQPLKSNSGSNHDEWPSLFYLFTFLSYVLFVYIYICIPFVAAQQFAYQALMTVSHENTEISVFDEGDSDQHKALHRVLHGYIFEKKRKRTHCF